MRPLVISILLTTSIAASAPAFGKPPAQANGSGGQEGAALLQKANRAVIEGAATAQTGRPADPDQGDDHASDRAIEIVCSKNTPAAQRSAICKNISPE
jgi:hypothetical protein